MGALVLASSQSCGGSTGGSSPDAPDSGSAACATHEDCGGQGRLCFGGACTAECENSLDCVGEPGDRTVCDPGAGACVECVASSDCADSEECSASRCVGFTSCRSSLDCAAGEVCDDVDARCVECVGDGDCENDERCVGRVCRPPCRSDKDCTPLGLLCDPGLGACVPAGVGGAAGAGGSAGAGAGGSSGASGGGTGGSAAETCAAAAAERGHLGCEFWATVVPNIVWSIFDFAIVATNPGDVAAEVTVAHDGTTLAQATLAPRSSRPFYLPWNAASKGGDSDLCGNVPSPGGSVRERAASYRVTSTRPVAVHQFSPIEHRGEGGPSGKDWSGCPGDQTCATTGVPIGCFSFSMDASMLLPTSTLGRDHFIDAPPGWPAANLGGYAAITATRAATSVTVAVSPTGQVLAGGPVPSASGGEIFTLTLDAGDVVVLAGGPTGTLAGSRITADAPIQVVAGAPCAAVPEGVLACDHLEEVVPATDALGTRYVVAPPPGPLGNVVGHVVRFVATSDGTLLEYPSGTRPPGAPATLDAGGAADLGVVTEPFEVVASQPLLVTSSLQGAEAVDATPAPDAKGDPALLVVPPVERFRRHVVFPAPDSAGEAWVLLVQPMAATVTLDGSPAPAATALGSSGMGVARVRLSPNSTQTHVVRSNLPVGVQVMGYAAYTSYGFAAAW